MSYFINAFAESARTEQDLLSLIKGVFDRQIIGWIESDTHSMVSLSAYYLPENLQDSVFFSITDGKKKNTATYLLDPRDYAPESDIGLPIKARERQNLIVSLCEEILHINGVSRIGIAMTDSDYIDELKFVSAHEFRSLLYRDFEEDSPPNIFYVINKP